jgi:hypothetical protein
VGEHKLLSYLLVDSLSAAAGSSISVVIERRDAQTGTSVHLLKLHSCNNSLEVKAIYYLSRTTYSRLWNTDALSPKPRRDIEAIINQDHC